MRAVHAQEIRSRHLRTHERRHPCGSGWNHPRLVIYPGTLVCRSRSPNPRISPFCRWCASFQTVCLQRGSRSSSRRSRFVATGCASLGSNEPEMDRQRICHCGMRSWNRTSLRQTARLAPDRCHPFAQSSTMILHRPTLIGLRLKKLEPVPTLNWEQQCDANQRVGIEREQATDQRAMVVNRARPIGGEKLARKVECL